MNAKKIMGAVLVALLALTAFAGVAAAADSVGTVFVYQQTDLKGTWTGDAGSVTFVNGVVAGENIKEGVYTNTSGYSMYLCYPTAVITGIAQNGTVKYSAIGGTVNNADWLNLTVSSPAGAAIWDILVTTPEGIEYKGSELFDLVPATPASYGVNYDGTNAGKGVFLVNLSNDMLKDLSGTYKLQALFKVGDAEKPLVDYIPNKFLTATDVYTVTFVDDEQEVTISASVDKVLAGKTFAVTVTGIPGQNYNITAKDAKDAEKKLNFVSAGANSASQNVNKIAFEMPNSGSITVYMNCTDAAKLTLSVAKDAEVAIEILKATLTATLGAPSYFIGNNIEVILSSDGEVGTGYKFNITGTNIDEIQFAGLNPKKDGDKYIYKIPTTGIKLDVGTYTIKVIDAGNNVVATIPVALKQPFISIAEAPEVVTQNKSATFLINAEAANGVQAYIFGTNYFNVTNSSILAQDDEDEDIPGVFNVTLPATETKKMATGQYFAVFQHPMYDGLFNINATKAGAVKLYTTTTAGKLAEEKVLFNVSDRQTANAAQALCDALESQNIDDMYVKASFFVVSTVDKDSFSISEIPTTVAQGETITITGVDTENDGQPVVVEMVSTAFAAVPKETVGSAAFIVASTEIAEDGTWEITLDTTGLNIDEYTLAVKIANELKESVTVNVVEADEPVNPEQPEEPEQPEQPEEPVAPATPGFGALAALAGLGAVAVLLLRRE